MCLGEIGRVRRVRPDGSLEVLLRRGPVTVSTLTAPEPVPAGAWVLTHSGFVLERLTESEAREALAARAGTEETEGGVQ